MYCESFDAAKFDLSPLLQGQMGSLTLKVDFYCINKSHPIDILLY